LLVALDRPSRPRKRRRGGIRAKTYQTQRRTRFHTRVTVLDMILKRFTTPDDSRIFRKGRFDVVRFAGTTLGRATYDPGWRWSTDVGAAAGQTLCQVSHVGMVISGRAAVADADGNVEEMRAGDVFFIPPGHDSWVIGDEPYVSLHFEGADEYACEA
jgi:mannose-6-phosphate isomerase-like protein (cupin superfamily)